MTNRDATAAKWIALGFAVALACLCVHHCRVVHDMHQRIGIAEWDARMAREHVADLKAEESRRMSVWLRPGEN